MTELEDGRWAGDLTTQLVDLDHPGDVVRVAGGWLAAQLAEEGFVWLKSRGTLERREGKRREQIHLQNSKWNRSGVSIRFGSVLNVRDGGLRAWRRAGPARTLRSDDWLCGHAFGTLLGSLVDGEVDLNRPEQRVNSLEAFLARVRQSALPWFASTTDPARLVTDVPDLTVSLHASDLMEWLVWQGDREQAEALDQRWLALDPII